MWFSFFIVSYTPVHSKQVTFYTRHLFTKVALPSNTSSPRVWYSVLTVLYYLRDPGHLSRSNTRVMLGQGYEPGMGLGKNNDCMASLVEIKENRGKFGLGYKPTWADMRRSVLERRNRGMGLQLRPQVREAPPWRASPHDTWWSPPRAFKLGTVMPSWFPIRKLASGWTTQGFHGGHNVIL